MLTFVSKATFIKEEEEKYLEINHIRNSSVIQSKGSTQIEDIQKELEVSKYLISRSENINKSDLIPTPKGKTIQETKRLLMEEHARAVAEHKAKIGLL